MGVTSLFTAGPLTSDLPAETLFLFLHQIPVIIEHFFTLTQYFLLLFFFVLAHLSYFNQLCGK